jgi:hypothetical protein
VIFLPIGQMFTLYCFLKIKEVHGPIFWATFSMVKVIHKFWYEMRWATVWAIFVTTSSGHPGQRPAFISPIKLNMSTMYGVNIFPSN